MELQDATRRYVVVSGVEVYPAGEELIAVQTEKDEVHRLNLTAAQVLGACDGRPVAEIAAQLRESYPDVPETRIEKDLEAVLSLLIGKGVIRLLAAGEAPPSAGSS